MPDAPTWDFIVDAAKKTTDRANGINGICLRGKAGWGENMAFLTAMSNFVRRQLVRHGLEAPVRQAGMGKTLDTYLDVMKPGPRARPRTASTRTALFQQGNARCGSTPPSRARS